MDNIKIPNHVGIILDGNGRWAKEKGLKRSDGHKAGYENLKKLTVHILNRGSKYLSVYAFSTENFKRDEKEVSYIMDLFAKQLKKDSKYFLKNNVKVVFSGRKDNLRKDVINTIDYLTEITKDGTNGTLNICLNYGGRAEIVDMAKNISEKVKNNELNIEDINEELISNNLYTNLPDIDFLIRTSGEQRVSNFMLWQISYAEFYFPKTYFPDFDELEYDKALLEYTKRDRRFGNVTK